MDAGISFNGLEHLQLTGAYGGDAGAGGPCSDFPEAPPRQATNRPGLYSMQAFHLYWDFDGNRYGMRDPLVVAPDGSQVSCAAPGGLDYGTRYYCVVTLDDGVYSARVVSEEDASGYDASDYDGLWKVLLFKVPPEDYLEALADDESGFQFHAGAVVLGGGEGEGVSARPDEVSVDYKTAVDGQGNPRTHRETVDGVEVDVPEKTDELEVKGWHEDDSVVGSSLAELMGLPVTGEPSNDVIVRDGGKGGPLRYYKVGQVDPSQMPLNPCRVVSISDGTSDAGNTPSKIYDLVDTGQHVTVEYTRDGNCEDEDDLQFTIPIVGPAGITGDFDMVTEVAYRLGQDGVRRLYATSRTLKFKSGVLTSVGNSVERLLAETIKHSQVYPSGT